MSEKPVSRSKSVGASSMVKRFGTKVRPWPMVVALSSIARRMAEAISTGWTSDLKAFAKTP
jgi:hypothetical protein